MRPITLDFQALTSSRVKIIRLRRHEARATQTFTKSRKIQLQRPTKNQKLLQASGLDQQTAQAVLAAMKALR